MKRVLFVIETLRGGGAERALSNIVTHFPKDWHIDILVNDESLIGYPFKGNILSLSMPEKKSFIYYTKIIIKRILYLRKIKKSNGYDACISFLDSANISNVLSGNKHCRTIVSVRSNMMSEKVGLTVKAGTRPLTKILYVHADKIVAVSKEIEMILIHQLKLPGYKVKAILNGYDCQWIRERMRVDSSDKESGDFFVSKDRKIVVTAGRLVEAKGQWHLIRAFSDVIRRVPQAQLIVLGNGSLGEYLTELVQKYGLENNVMFIGYSENPFYYYAMADVFVLPSLYEGYPNALAEAVCCGTPCVAADVHSGAREILAPSLDVMGERVSDISEEEYGILVPVCSGRKYRNYEPLEPEERKLTEAIVMLLNDSVKRQHYKQKSLERSQELDINAIVDQWINVILENEK